MKRDDLSGGILAGNNDLPFGGNKVRRLEFLFGEMLAHFTKEELKDGRKWFRRIIFLSLVGGFVGLILGNDALLFSLFFVAVVTSRSLIK